MSPPPNSLRSLPAYCDLCPYRSNCPPTALPNSAPLHLASGEVLFIYYDVTTAPLSSAFYHHDVISHHCLPFISPQPENSRRHYSLSSSIPQPALSTRPYPRDPLYKFPFSEPSPQPTGLNSITVYGGSRAWWR